MQWRKNYMIKLEIKEFNNVKLKLKKLPNGEIFIDFSPIIKHANKLIKQKHQELIKRIEISQEISAALEKNGLPVTNHTKSHVAKYMSLFANKKKIPTALSVMKYVKDDLLNFVKDLNNARNR